MKEITVFTPTYNRIKTLGRVYESLLSQTNKDFIWLIIDDGSTDNTSELIGQWINGGKIEIEYHYKENGGKHSAMRLAYRLAKTKYFISIDSDDELLPDAIATFEHNWKDIEIQGLENVFAEVSALTVKTDNQLVGNFYFPANKNHIDSFWHEMVLKYHNYNEHIICWNLQKLIETADIPERFWNSDKVNFLGEFVLWARLGKKYKTRYINKPLRVYHLDGGESLSRIQDKTKGHYNILVMNKYFLDENLDYFWWSPKFYINLILKFIISGIELGISPVEILKACKTYRFRLTYLAFSPLGLMGYIYFKYFKKRYWF